MLHIIKKEDCLIVFIFAAICFSIVAKSFFTYHGYLTSDSMSYLGTAQKLIDLSKASLENSVFSPKWPLGYPVLIYCVAKITGLSVFWASKLLNMLLVGFILIIFRSLFKRNAYLYGLIFFFSAYIEIFTYTWSESLFICLIILFVATTYKILITEKPNFYIYFTLFISSMLLFLSRYVGAFSFVVIGLLGLCFLYKKNNSKAFILIFIAILEIVLMALYLNNNFITSGFITGPRYPATESNLQLLMALFKAIIAEMAIPVHRFGIESLIATLFEFSILAFFVFRYKHSIKDAILNNKISILASTFFIVGISYIFSIVLLRWFTFFDSYSFRLLAPGSFLIFIGLIKYFSDISTLKGKKIIFSYIFIFSSISLLLFVPVRTIIKFDEEKGTYPTFQNNIIKKYEKVKGNSIVIDGSYHLTYLRTDIILEYTNQKENWPDFLERINANNKDIYIVIKGKDHLMANGFMPALNQEYDDGELIKIN
jgi:hypothetical protein